MEKQEKYKGVQRNVKEEQTATTLLDITRLSMWLHCYYDIYLIEKKGQQSVRILPTHHEEEVIP